MRTNALIVVATLASVLALATLTGCSREKIDWKSAEAADTVEGYDHFIERHPDSALATQARARVAQLNEDRDWKKATAADTAEAYKQFLAQHESGKWAEEARIRVENFSLDGTATGPAKPTMTEPPVAGSAAPRATSAPLPASPSAAATPPAPAHGPKEALVPPMTAKSSAAAPSAKASPAPTSPGMTAAQPASVSSSAAKPAPTRVAAATPAASAAKPAAAPTPASTSTSQFGIQLGAFRSQDAALKNWKQLQVKYDSDLHGLFAHAVPVKQTSGQLFRLQAPVGGESRARAICASLAKQSQPCVVVLPQP